MPQKHNTTLRKGALLALFITSYIPLFATVIVKQINSNWEYLHWGGVNREAICVFLSNFGMSSVLTMLMIFGLFGLFVLLHNMKLNVANGQICKVVSISNRNSEAIGYIATYIVPFSASNFSDFFECGIFVVVMILIYSIYTKSNMILINPMLNILHYSLLDVEYEIVGDDSKKVYDALVITEIQDYKENVYYNLYKIGFKLYYGKEKRRE